MNKLKIIVLSIWLTACSNSLISKDPNNIKAPFDGKRFSNIEPTPPKSFLTVLKWRFTRMWEANEWPVSIDNPTFIPPEKKVEEGVSISVINHATVLIQTGGLNIITDPIYSERCSPVSFFGPKRVIKPGIKFEDLPKIDYILIGHNHYDHLDLPTIKQITDRDKSAVLVGLGNAGLLESEGIKNVTEMDWWDELDAKTLKIHFVPSQHWSGRGVFDRRMTLWGGFVLKGEQNIYFASDTGYGKFFKMIKEKLGPMDVSLIPIGAYEPRWFMKAQHLNPDDSVRAFLDLESKKAVGIHFGTFESLTDEAIDQPAKDLKKALIYYKVDQSRFIVPEFGKSYNF